MNIYDLETCPVERIETSDPKLVKSLIDHSRLPLIFCGLEKEFEVLRGWDLKYFGSLGTEVPVQKPEQDGVNYFREFFRLPMVEFVDRILSGDELYIGAREFLGRKGVVSNKDGLGQLGEHFVIPEFVEKSRIWSGNLWAGSGRNKTLLHYDPWDGILMLGSGRKEFRLFPNDESSKMFQYGAWDLVSLAQGKVLHSKISPMNVQQEYVGAFRTARAFGATLNSGEMIFIPAGFWHFVESFDINIGVNFFIHFEDRRLQLQEPLRTYWIKDNITLWPYRVIKRVRGLLGRWWRKLKNYGK